MAFSSFQKKKKKRTAFSWNFFKLVMMKLFDFVYTFMCARARVVAFSVN